MAYEGAHYALTVEQRRFLLAQEDDEARRQYVAEGIADGCADDLKIELEQAWDAIHRCLTGQPASRGDLDENAGEAPLNLCIMGGRNYYDGDDYVLKMLETHEVREVARAIAGIDKVSLSELYHHHCNGAFDEYGDDDCEYTWRHF